MSSFVFCMMCTFGGTKDAVPFALAFASPAARLASEETPFGLRYGSSASLRFFPARRDALFPNHLNGNELLSMKDYHVPHSRKPFSCHELSCSVWRSGGCQPVFWWLQRNANRKCSLSLVLEGAIENNFDLSAAFPFCNVASLALLNPGTAFLFNVKNNLSSLQGLLSFFAFGPNWLSHQIVSGELLFSLPSLEILFLPHFPSNPNFTISPRLTTFAGGRFGGFGDTLEHPCSLHLQGIRNLHLSHGTLIQDWVSLYSLRDLVSLHVEECQGLPQVLDLSCLPALSAMSVWWCNTVEVINVGSNEWLERVAVCCRQVVTLDGLRYKRYLAELRLQDCRRLAVLDVTGCSALESLTVNACPQLGRVDGGESLTALRALAINEPNLLHAWDCIAVKDAKDSEAHLSFPSKFPWVKTLTNLEMLFCELTHLDCFPLSKLEVLEVVWCPEVIALDDLSVLSCLKRLVFSDCPKLVSINVKSAVPLVEVSVNRCHSLETIDGMANRQHLRRVEVSECELLYELIFARSPLLTHCSVIRCSRLRRVLRTPRTAEDLLHIDIHECPVLKEIVGFTMTDRKSSTLRNSSTEIQTAA